MKDFQFDHHIFQMGWFNHQVVILYYPVIWGITLSPIMVQWKMAIFEGVDPIGGKSFLTSMILGGSVFVYPIGSMYCIFTYIYHKKSTKCDKCG